MFTETGCGMEYGNCKNANALFWLQGRQQCETGLLPREYAELAFLASFAREVDASLNSREVVLATAKLLYSYFQYELAVFSLPADSRGVTAFSPLDAAGCMRFSHGQGGFPRVEIARDKRLSSSGPCHSGTARVPGQLPGDCGNRGQWDEDYALLRRRCRREGTHDLLTGIAESLTTALRNAREHDRVKELSVRDGLTGLYNRRVLEEILNVEESKRNPAPLAILMMDVDDFKAINDTFGHPAGDRVLSVLGKLLQDNCRRENIVARYGGEEFAILLTNTGLTVAAAMQTAERLRKVLAAQDFAFSGRKVRLTVSIGVAYSTGKTAAPKTILARADQALYQAKRSGKNRVCLHEAKHIELCPVKNLHVRAVR